MTKEEASRTIDAIITARQSGRKVGIVHDDRLWLVESMFRNQSKDYEFKCEYFKATRYFSLSNLERENIFISL